MRGIGRTTQEMSAEGAGAADGEGKISIYESQSEEGVTVVLEVSGPQEDEDNDLSADDSVPLIPVKKEEERNEERNKKEEPKPKSKATNLRTLFFYATPLDWIFMFIGGMCALLHGITQIVFSIGFGSFINIFVDQTFTQSVLFLLHDNFTMNCSRPVDPYFVGLTVSNASSLVFHHPTVPCSTVIEPDYNLSFIIHNCSAKARCIDNTEFIYRVDMLILIFFGIAVGVFILSYLEVLLFELASERQVKKIRLAFFKSVLKQEIGWFDAHGSGELTSMTVDGIEKIRDGIGSSIAFMIDSLASFFSGFIIAFIFEWRLALLLTIFIPLLAITAFTYTWLVFSMSSRELKEYASAGKVAEEVLASIRTVVAFGGEKRECERYNTRLKEARLIGAKKGAVLGLNIGIIFFLFFSMYAVSFWFGAFLASIKEATGGSVMIVFFSLMTGSFAVGETLPNMEIILTAAGSAQTIFDIINRKSHIDPSSEEGEKPETFKGTIELKDVSFSYPTRPDIQVLEKFDLTVEAGKTYAIVGPSGCGKSTVIQLIQRFYDPDVGEVHVGGKDIRSLNSKWMRNHIGLVAQEPVLFDTTIAENILYGTEDATMEDVKIAAKNANAHDFISQLPKGYDTPVGEGGIQLSGGQKQRIAIARALIRNPKILLLDEATSALDTGSESIVQQALDRARAGRTTIVIAHRLSTIRNADVIVSVENGKVVEKGTHLELMDNEGLYYELVTAQLQGVDEGAHILAADELLSYREHKQSRVTSDQQEGLEKQESSFDLNPETAKGRRLPGGTLKIVNSLLSTSNVDTIQEKSEEIPPVSITRLMRENAPEWWLIALGLMAAGIDGAVFPVFSFFFGGAVHAFSQPAEQILPSINLWAASLLLIGVISAGSQFLRNVSFTVSGENLTARLREKTFKAMLRQEIGWFDDEKNSSGALVTRLAEDAALVQGATGARLGTVVEIIFGMFVAFVISLAISWVLTLVVLCMVPLMFLSGVLEVRSQMMYAVNNKKALEKAGVVAILIKPSGVQSALPYLGNLQWEIAGESITHIRTVTSFGLQERLYSLYESNILRPHKQALRNAVLHGLTYAISQGVSYLLYAIIFRFGAFQMTLPVHNVAHANFYQILIVFSALVFGATGAGQAGAFAPNYAKAKIAASSIFHLLDREPHIDTYSMEGAKPENSDVAGDITANEVIFRYPTRPNVRVLQGLNLLVKAGQTLALVGPSGCGKSTVVSLLERFYDPTSGALSLDGIELTDYNISWLRSKIGIVLQEPTLFDCSIADNIRYGANFREVSQDEVIQAAKDANIHNFVASLPMGYDTNVGSRGTQLSGGQKQRVAIARALIRNPKILLLDEATSALDTESEKIVQEALDRAREGRTSIVIAHRLSTIYNSDCIAVISGGKIAESGTHAELLKMKGLYYKLHHVQMGKTGAGGENDDL